jgi:hypothetical protein
MRGLNVLELVGLYLLAIGLLAGIGAGFVVSIGLGLLVVAVEGVSVGLGLMVLAAAREAQARANGAHAAGAQGGAGPQIRSAA